MANAIVDIVTEMRDDMREVKKLLVGNGAIGLCEFTRATRTDLDELTGQVKQLATTVGQIADAQRDHQHWHERAENLTIQQTLIRSGTRFAIALGIIFVVIVLLVGGIDGAVGMLKTFL